MTTKTIQSQLRNRIESSIAMEGWDWVAPEHPFVVASARRLAGSRIHAIKVEREKWWTKSGGNVAVNYTMTDQGYLDYYRLNFNGEVIYASLATPGNDTDKWFPVSIESLNDAVVKIQSLFLGPGMDLFEDIEVNGMIMSLPPSVQIRPGYAYAFYAGHEEEGRRLLVESLMHRDSSDLLFQVLLKVFGISEELKVEIRSIQMQSAKDQGRRMTDLIAAMGWE